MLVFRLFCVFPSFLFVCQWIDLFLIVIWVNSFVYSMLWVFMVFIHCFIRIEWGQNDERYKVGKNEWTQTFAFFTQKVFAQIILLIDRICFEKIIWQLFRHLIRLFSIDLFLFFFMECIHLGVKKHLQPFPVFLYCNNFIFSVILLGILSCCSQQW